MSFSFYDYTRVVINLPTRTPFEQQATKILIHRFGQKHGGSTNSAVHNAVFVGRWQASAQSVICIDAICILTIDVPFSLNADIADVADIVETLRLDAAKYYGQFYSQQDKFWISVSAILIWDESSAP